MSLTPESKELLRGLHLALNGNDHSDQAEAYAIMSKYDLIKMRDDYEHERMKVIMDIARPPHTLKYEPITQ